MTVVVTGPKKTAEGAKAPSTAAEKDKKTTTAKTKNTGGK